MTKDGYKYLYHYTTIDTLVLIFKNRTLKFTPLTDVDDLEEAKSKDFKNIGKYTYVSCWTYDEEESIPMWHMYSNNLQGVRIKLKVFPFKKYIIEKGEFYFDETIQTFIDLPRIFSEDLVFISANQPTLNKIEYTENEEDLYPQIKSTYKNTPVNKQKNDISNSTSYSTNKIGIYKRINWRFQNEIRYIIRMKCITYNEIKKLYTEKRIPNFEKIIEERYSSTSLNAPYKDFFLELDPNSIENIEILLGPKTTEAQEETVNLVKERYCPTAKIRSSSLKIK